MCKEATGLHHYHNIDQALQDTVPKQIEVALKLYFFIWYSDFDTA